MIESLKYTKEMPDADDYQYVVTRGVCVNHQFKDNAERFVYAGAKGFKFIDLAQTKEIDVIENWENLKFQNVTKANFIVSDSNTMPEQKETINQNAIFNAQKSKYVNVSDNVSILNSFSIFIYDYLE